MFRLILIISLVWPLSGLAQQITLNASAKEVCPGNVVSVSYVATGAFAAGTSFALRRTDTFSPQPAYLTISPAQSATSGVFSVSIAEAAPVSGFSYQIAASLPNGQTITSRDASISIRTLPTAQLHPLPPGSDPLNKNAPLSLSITATGGVPYSFTMADGLTVVKGSNESYYPVQVIPPKTTTYQLVRVANACGAGPASGSLTVQVGPVDLKVVPPPIHCWDGWNKVAFFTDVPLPTNTVFEAELISADSSPISLTVSGTSSPLQIRLPARPAQTPFGGYSIRLFSRQANVFSRWPVSPFSPPRASIDGDIRITAGQSATIAAAYSTDATWNMSFSNASIRLNTGQAVSYGESFFRTQPIVVQPTQTTAYSIVQVSGTCSENVQLVKRTVTVQVDPGVRFDTLSTRTICAGQPVTLHYTAFGGYVLPTALLVSLGNGLTTEARLTQPGQLTFVFPPTAAPQTAQPGQCRLLDATTNALVLTIPHSVTLNTPPKLFFDRPPTDTLDRPGLWRQQAQLSGGGLVSLTLTTGQTFTFRGNSRSRLTPVVLPVFVANTTRFSVRDIRNACGVGSSTATQTITVRQPVSGSASIAVQLAPSGQPINCPGTSFGLNLFTTGTFGTDNQFSLFISDSAGRFASTPVQTITGGVSMSFTWPRQPGTYLLRVMSSHPALTSNLLSLTTTAYTPPTAQLSPSYQPEYLTPAQVDILPNQPIWAKIYCKGGRKPYHYTYTDGSSGVCEETDYTQHDVGNATRFGIEQVTDACGTRAVASPPTRLNLTKTGTIPTQLSQSVFSALSGPSIVETVCAEQLTDIPFVIVGEPTIGTSFTVQVSTDYETWQSLPTSGTASPLQVRFPQRLTRSWPYYRIIGTDLRGNVIPAVGTNRVLVNAPPTASLSAKFYGPQATPYYYDSTGVNPYVVYSNGKQAWQDYYPLKSTDYRSNREAFSFVPGSFSLVAAYNGCGVSTASHEWTPRPAPTLPIFRTNKNFFCQGDSITLSYTVANADANSDIRFFIRDGRTFEPTLLGQTKQPTGSQTVLLPTLPSGMYSLFVEVANPSVVFYHPESITLSQRPSISFSTTTLVQGQSTTSLPLSGTFGAGAFFVTLATPTVVAELRATPEGLLPVADLRPGLYSISSARNECGVGRAAGTLDVVEGLNPAPTMLYPFVQLSLPSASPCQKQPLYIGSHLLSNYQPWTLPTHFSLYIGEADGNQRRSILYERDPASTQTVILPASALPDRPFRLWLERKTPLLYEPIPNPAGGYVFDVKKAATATLLTPNNATLQVFFTGTPPWQYTLSAPNGVSALTANTSPATLTPQPDSTTTYRLTHVQNDCGSGPVSGTALITIAKVLAAEPALPLQLRSWPNPTAGTLQLDGEVGGLAPVQVRIHTLLGTLVQSQSMQPVGGRVRTQLDISQLPTGTYLLTAEQDGRRSMFKVLKE
jgi:hypothetical protein